MISSSKQGIIFACGYNSHQIDVNFGTTAAIAEMLLQSHGGEIKILPALPEAWPSGHIRGLRARGGFEFDISWEKNQLKKAEILSIYGNKCRIRSDVSILVRSGRKIISTKKLSASVIEFDTDAGDVYILEPKLMGNPLSYFKHPGTYETDRNDTNKICWSGRVCCPHSGVVTHIFSIASLAVPELQTFGLIEKLNLLVFNQIASCCQ